MRLAYAVRLLRQLAVETDEHLGVVRVRERETRYPLLPVAHPVVFGVVGFIPR